MARLGSAQRSRPSGSPQDEGCQPHHAGEEDHNAREDAPRPRGRCGQRIILGWKSLWAGNVKVCAPVFLKRRGRLLSRHSGPCRSAYPFDTARLHWRAGFTFDFEPASDLCGLGRCDRDYRAVGRARSRSTTYCVHWPRRAFRRLCADRNRFCDRPSPCRCARIRSCWACTSVNHARGGTALHARPPSCHFRCRVQFPWRRSRYRNRRGYGSILPA